jgi:hypothetical protein
MSPERRAHDREPFRVILPANVGLFRRRCRKCGQPAELKIAPRIHGQAGTTDVEFTNFPYSACECGRLARWAFDPGVDFSTQLFYDENGLATADGDRDAPACRRCGSDLGRTEVVTLEATAHLAGFAPIGLRIQVNGYSCSSCGLSQAPANEFAANFGIYSGFVQATDSGRALSAAVRSLGLPH